MSVLTAIDYLLANPKKGLRQDRSECSDMKGILLVYIKEVILKKKPIKSHRLLIPTIEVAVTR